MVSVSEWAVECDAKVYGWVSVVQLRAVPGDIQFAVGMAELLVTLIYTGDGLLLYYNISGKDIYVEKQVEAKTKAISSDTQHSNYWSQIIKLCHFKLEIC